MSDKTIYLDGSHEGWIINLLTTGVQVISPACGELKIEQLNSNTVDITEEPVTVTGSVLGKAKP